MQKAVETALRESIAHWEKNVLYPEAMALGYDDCALCALFHPIASGGLWDPTDPHNCSGCPVREAAGLPLCKGTPYYAVFTAFEDDDLALSHSFARKELRFLRTLLPKGNKNV